MTRRIHMNHLRETWERKVPLPPGQRRTIPMLRDLPTEESGSAMAQRQADYLKGVRGRAYASARRGYYRRRWRQAIEWAYIGLPDLRTRLLYAKLEPWGA